MQFDELAGTGILFETIDFYVIREKKQFTVIKNGYFYGHYIGSFPTLEKAKSFTAKAQKHPKSF